MGWKFGSALKPTGVKDGWRSFAPMTLEDVIDSPLIAGRHLKSLPIETKGFPPFYMHFVSESPSAIRIDDELASVIATSSNNPTSCSARLRLTNITFWSFVRTSFLRSVWSICNPPSTAWTSGRWSIPKNAKAERLIYCRTKSSTLGAESIVVRRECCERITTPPNTRKCCGFTKA